MSLVLLALAAFAVWEYLLDISPISPPTWLGAPLVAALVFGLSYLSDRWLTVIAGAGLVGLLHQVVRRSSPAPVVIPRGRSRVPPIP